MKKTGIIAALLLIALSGCNTFRGVKYDFQNLGHMFGTGIANDGFPEERQMVNYHQPMFHPQPDKRYFLKTDMSRYY